MNQISNKSILLIILLLFMLGNLIQAQSLKSIEQPPNGWLAHPLNIVAFGGASSPQGYSPSQMRAAYGLPSSGGDGATIAIINAFDTPNILTYYNAFSQQYGLPDNNSGNF